MMTAEVVEGEGNGYTFAPAKTRERTRESAKRRSHGDFGTRVFELGKRRGRGPDEESNYEHTRIGGGACQSLQKGWSRCGHKIALVGQEYRSRGKRDLK